MLQLSRSRYAPPPQSQRLGNDSDYDLKSFPKVNSNVGQFVSKHVKPGDLSDIGLYESRVTQGKPVGELEHRTEQKLATMITALKGKSVSAGDLEYLAHQKISLNTARNAIITSVCSFGGSLLLMFPMNFHPAVALGVGGVIQTVASLVQMGNDSAARRGFQVVKRQLKK
jgi:hypothetical protein